MNLNLHETPYPFHTAKKISYESTRSIRIVWNRIQVELYSSLRICYRLLLSLQLLLNWGITQYHYYCHRRSQGQVFTEANFLIMSPVRYIFYCGLWKPNILPLFNLGWWLQHSVAALLHFFWRLLDNLLKLENYADF